MVCSPAALVGEPKGWAAETLREGEVALLVDDGGLEAIVAAAHTLDLVTVSIVRSEESATPSLPSSCETASAVSLLSLRARSDVLSCRSSHQGWRRSRMPPVEERREP
jgi:hypothetical protein